MKRYVESESLGGLDIDNQLKLGRLFDRWVRLVGEPSGRKLRETLNTAFARAIFNDEVLALHVAELPQSAPEGVDVGGVERGRCCIQHADAPDLASLLRQRNRGPRDRRTADKCDELAPSHARHRDL